MKSMRVLLLAIMQLQVVFFCGLAMGDDGVAIKNLARIQGVRENAITGYGLVVGLSGSGDSARSKSTRQSVVNVMKNFGVDVTEEDVNSRNVAAVMVSATLSPYAEEGDVIDVNVSSIGDAKSLVGGTLLLMPLKAANSEVYALAQGEVSVGGFYYDANGNAVQKNHPTVGIVSGGGRVEKSVEVSALESSTISFLLGQPDFLAADKIEDAINASLKGSYAVAQHAGKVTVTVPQGVNKVDLIARIEQLPVAVSAPARVVVNERTGTIVSGGDVKLEPVTIAQGSINVVVSTDYNVSQPSFVRGIIPDSISTTVVPDTEIDVNEPAVVSVVLGKGSSVEQLITAMKESNLSTRDIISVLQAVKRSGSLHAELIIQ